MAISGRIQSVDRDVEALLADALDPKARSAQLAAFARQELKDAEDRNAAVTGAVTPHDTYVDGRRDASEDAVKPDGVIVYEFNLVEELLVFIGEELVKASPFRSGAYAASHMLFVDGVEVDAGAAPPTGREYVFVNRQPYARKIEGTPERPPQSPQAPDGVYDVVAALAQARFGNIAAIGFGYRSSVDVARAGQGAKARKAERDSRQPAIIVTLR